MIKKVTMYEAKDGQLLPSHDAAQTYNDRLDLYKYVDANPIYCGSSEAQVDSTALHLWLQEHPRIFIKLLSEERDAS